MAPASQVLAQRDILEGIFTNPAASDEERIATAVGSLGFSSLILHGIESVFPDFNVDSAYATAGEPIRALAEVGCLPEITEELTATIPPLLLFENSVESFIVSEIEQQGIVDAYFESVEPGNRLLGAPLFIAQGLSDTVVFPNSSITLQTQLAAVSNTDVDPTITTYQGTDHLTVLEASFNDALAFINTQFAAQ